MPISDMNLVFVILAVAGVLFASGRLRLDVVALLTVLSLMLTGVLTPGEALAGFGNPVVPLIAALLVVGHMLTRTGIAYGLGLWMMRASGSSERRLLVLLMLTAALLGSLMSSTAVVAIFIPVVLTVSARAKLNASRLLMPLSFAGLMSGMLTLIATPPNLVISAELASQGLPPFQFFTIAPIGSAVLVVGIVYMLLVGRRLLPGGAEAPARSDAQTIDDLLRGFGLEDRRQRVRVRPDSPLAGKTLGDSDLGRRGLRVVGIERVVGRSRQRLAASGPTLEIHAGDVLAGTGDPEAVAALAAELGLEVLPISSDDLEGWQQEFGVAVVLIHPDSSLIGRSLADSGFRSRHGLHAMGGRRGAEVVHDFPNEPLAAGDSLLVHGLWKRIAQLQRETEDFVVLSLPSEIADVAPARSRAPVALAIVTAMILLSVFEVVPVVAAVLMAALAAVFTRCLSMEDGYQSIHWSSLVLIAGMLPVADALDKTGGVDAIVGLFFGAIGDAGPRTVMSLLFGITALLGLVLSNTATAVLMAPIAIAAAELLGVSPLPFALAIAIAASAAFVTPVSTPVVTLVVGPGNYRFGDFLKVGIPLLVLTWLTVLLLVPLFYPF